MEESNNNMRPEEERKMFAVIAASYADDVKREEHYHRMIVGPLITSCVWMGAVTLAVALMAVKPHYDWFNKLGMIIWASVGAVGVINNVLCILVARHYFKRQIEHHLNVRQIALAWKDSVL